jgi:hypothetical protein
MILTALKSLDLVLGGAVTTNQLEYSGSYVDVTDATGEVAAEASVDGTSNNTTHVVMVAAPSAGVTRHVTELTIYQKDTVAAEVIVKLNNNGTRRVKIDADLDPQSSLVYGAD